MPRNQRSSDAVRKNTCIDSDLDPYLILAANRKTNDLEEADLEPTQCYIMYPCSTDEEWASCLFYVLGQAIRKSNDIR